MPVSSRRAVDGHRHRGLRVTEVKTTIELFGIFYSSDAHTAVAYLAVYIRAVIGVLAIECDRVKCSR
jgi:hypothetical protein